MIHERNPFSTCYTAPGCVPFQVGETTAAAFFAQLHTQWVESGRVSAIVGPHGCGKSTLLAALQGAWAKQYSYRISKVALHNGQRTLPAEIWQRDFQQLELILVDGYEQLGWRARWHLNRLLRRKSCGLLVTTHAPSRLPTLYRVEPDFGMLLAVVRRLLAPWVDAAHAESFIQRHARSAWAEAGANARETLFRLYDCWEAEVAQLVKAGTV